MGRKANALTHNRYPSLTGNEVHVVSAYDNAEMTVRYYFDAASPTGIKDREAV